MIVNEYIAALAVQVHMFLVYVAIAGVVTLALEMTHRHSPLAALSRAYITALHVSHYTSSNFYTARVSLWRSSNISNINIWEHTITKNTQKIILQTCDQEITWLATRDGQRRRVLNQFFNNKYPIRKWIPSAC